MKKERDCKRVIEDQMGGPVDKMRRNERICLILFVISKWNQCCLFDHMYHIIRPSGEIYCDFYQFDS
jgi:hypothetical protein